MEMKKQYANECLTMLERIFDSIDTDRSTETVLAATFVAEFWREMSPMIVSYINSSENIKIKLRDNIKRQREILQGIK